VVPQLNRLTDRKGCGFLGLGDCFGCLRRGKDLSNAQKAELRTDPEAGQDAGAAIVRQREVWMPEAGGFVATPIYARERLRPGNRFAGPAVVEQMDATTLVPTGMTAQVDRWLNLILEAA